MNCVCGPPEHRFINQDNTQVADVWLVTAKGFDKTCTWWTPSRLNLSQFTILKIGISCTEMCFMTVIM